MQILMVFLFDETYLTEVLLAMTQVCENKLVIQEGVTNEEHLSAALSVFAEFGSALSGRQKFCKIITTLTDRKDPVALLCKALLEANIDFKQQALGNICTVPVGDSLIAEDQ